MTPNQTEKVNNVRYFTLVELLVVIAVITILAALLLPALRKAKEIANMVVCANNLKQQGVATVSYANTYRRYHPPFHYWDGATPIGPYWAGNLLPFLDEQTEVFVCPSDRSPRSNPDLPQCNYANSANGYDFVNEPDERGMFGIAPSGQPISATAKQSQIAPDTMMYTERSWEGSTLEQPNEAIKPSGVSYVHFGYYASTTHGYEGGRAHYVFADVHVTPYEQAVVELDCYGLADFHHPWFTIKAE